MTCPVLANSVDPDQFASEEANWSGSALFVNMWIYIKNLDQVIWLAGRDSLIYSAWEGLSGSTRGNQGEAKELDVASPRVQVCALTDWFDKVQRAKCLHLW